jgi:hypothetical protein
MLLLLADVDLCDAPRTSPNHQSAHFFFQNYFWIGTILAGKKVVKSVSFNFRNRKQQIANHGGRAVWGTNCLRSLGRQPVTVAERSEAWTVLARSKAGIMGSNPTERHGCLCVRLFCVYAAALRRADHSSNESYPLCKKYYETEEEARAQQRAIEPLMNEWMKDNKSESHYNSEYRTPMRKQ